MTRSISRRWSRLEGTGAERRRSPSSSGLAEVPRTPRARPKHIIRERFGQAAQVSRGGAPSEDDRWARAVSRRRAESRSGSRIGGVSLIPGAQSLLRNRRARGGRSRDDLRAGFGAGAEEADRDRSDDHSPEVEIGFGGDLAAAPPRCRAIRWRRDRTPREHLHHSGLCCSSPRISADRSERV